MGEAHEDARTHETSGGGGEIGVLVAPIGGFDEAFHPVQAGLDKAVADGEAVLAGEFRGSLDDPLEQCFHAEGDHQRGLRSRSIAGGSASGPRWLESSLRASLIAPS